jgi:UDP-glucose 4-epimerase
MSKVVIFGANGFIGQKLTTNLAGSGEEIVAFDRFSSYQRGANHPFDTSQNIKMVIGDFFNRSDVETALENADYVFHLVSATNPAASNNDPFIDIDTNIKSSIELFDLCTKNKVKKVIFLSSGGTVYGDLNSDRIDELALPQPRSPYGIGKLTIEHYLRYFKYVANLDYMIYRVANPYGPGQNIHGKQGVIPIFMNQFLTGQPVTVYGDGSMVRDYLYIDDLINMIVGSYKSDNKYSEYNLGSGKGVSVADILLAIEKFSGRSVKQNHLPAPSTFVHRIVMNIDRFVDEFGINPEINLEEGINRTWDYVKAISD